MVLHVFCGLLTGIVLLEEVHVVPQEVVKHLMLQSPVQPGQDAHK